jgi:hypothetical protein
LKEGAIHVSTLERLIREELDATESNRLKIGKAIQRVESNCSACHARFRNMPRFHRLVRIHLQTHCESRCFDCAATLSTEALRSERTCNGMQPSPWYSWPVTACGRSTCSAAESLSALGLSGQCPVSLAVLLGARLQWNRWAPAGSERSSATWVPPAMLQRH